MTFDQLRRRPIALVVLVSGSLAVLQVLYEPTAR